MKTKTKKLLNLFSLITFVCIFLWIIFAISFQSYFQALDWDEFPGIFLYIVLSSILISSIVIYRKNISKSKYFNRIILILEEFYPEVPFFILGIGYLLFIIQLVLTWTTEYTDDYVMAIGFLFILIGFFLLLITLLAKRSLERRIFFTLNKANEIVNQTEDRLAIDVKNLKRYILLTNYNAKRKLGKGLELKYKIDLEYTFSTYLPFYLEFADEKELFSFKKNLEMMLKSVNEKNEIDWNSFQNAIFKLNDDMITYLKENNFNITYRKLSRRLEWLDKNKEVIFQAFQLIMPIILLIISVKLSPGFKGN